MNKNVIVKRLPFFFSSFSFVAGPRCSSGFLQTAGWLARQDGSCAGRCVLDATMITFAFRFPPFRWMLHGCVALCIAHFALLCASIQLLLIAAAHCCLLHPVARWGSSAQSSPIFGGSVLAANSLSLLRVIVPYLQTIRQCRELVGGWCYFKLNNLHPRYAASVRFTVGAGRCCCRLLQRVLNLRAFSVRFLGLTECVRARLTNLLHIKVEMQNRKV